MERYWDCSLCRVENKGQALRCRSCHGKLRGRERLLFEVADVRRLRPRAMWLSLIAPGLGQIYVRRWATGVVFGVLLPLALGLVLAVWHGFGYWHVYLAGAAVFVMVLAAADARWGPARKRPPCQKACPADVPIPDYLELIRVGDQDQGYGLLRTRIPLVGTVGRICPHPCEARCLRGIDGEPIAINGCKRYLADAHREDRRASARPAAPQVVRLNGAGPRVAVVGSGPAGLACAYYLSLLGASANVFEAGPVPGGRLATTIPDYRLPFYIVEEEIEDLQAVGVTFHTGVRVGPGGLAVGDLLQEYGAVFLAVGAERSIALEVPGADLCLDFQEVLRAAKTGNPPVLGSRVAVVGGGNAAVDVCRTVRRLGAGEVHLLYRRTRDEMPARADEIQEAIREGIRFRFLADPKGIERTPGGALRIEVQKMRLGPRDASGRPRPLAVEGETWALEVDAVIPALGQRVDPGILDDPALAGLRRLPDGRVWADPATQRTSLARVYAGGDVVTGPATAVHAMAQGRRAALSIFGEIAPERVPTLRLADRRLRVPPPVHRETPEARIREEMPRIGLRSRLEGFREVELGFHPGEAQREAGRCLQCHREL